MPKAGEFQIDVWEGGYPVWCVVKRDGAEVMRLHHNQLADLHYVVGRAMTQARMALPDRYKEEV